MDAVSGRTAGATTGVMPRSASLAAMHKAALTTASAIITATAGTRTQGTATSPGSAAVAMSPPPPGGGGGGGAGGRHSGNLATAMRHNSMHRVVQLSQLASASSRALHVTTQEASNNSPRFPATGAVGSVGGGGGGGLGGIVSASASLPLPLPLPLDKFSAASIAQLTAVAPALNARPFDTSHTLFLEMVTAAAAAGAGAGAVESGGSGGGAVGRGVTPSGGGGVLLGALVPDCARWVQDVRRPSRDVYMFMAAGGAAGISAAAAAAGPIAMQSLALIGLAAGVSGGGTSGTVSAGSAAGVGAGGGGGGGPVLGLYLAFGSQLPPRLLEAVQASCASLVREVSLSCGSSSSRTPVPLSASGFFPLTCYRQHASLLSYVLLPASSSELRFRACPAA